MNSFDMGKWTIKLLNINSVYKALDCYVSDEKALGMHINNYDIYKFEDGDDDIKKLKLSEFEYKDDFYANIKMDIESSFEFYSSQIIVLLATYLENINIEFFENIFINKNELIHNFIESEKKGYIKLDLVLKSVSKDEIINELINIAKKNAVNGSFEKIRERIFQLTKYNIDKKLIELIQKNILDKRNSIIHESTSFKMKSDKITECINLVENYLIVLGTVCKEKSLPYNDPANLLN